MGDQGPVKLLKMKSPSLGSMGKLQRLAARWKIGCANSTVPQCSNGRQDRLPSPRPEGGQCPHIQCGGGTTEA